MQALNEYTFADIALAYQIVAGQKLPANAAAMNTELAANIDAILAELAEAAY